MISFTQLCLWSKLENEGEMREMSFQSQILFYSTLLLKFKTHDNE